MVFRIKGGCLILYKASPGLRVRLTNKTLVVAFCAANGDRHEGYFGGELLRAPGDSVARGPSAFRAGILHPPQDIEGEISFFAVTRADRPLLHAASVRGWFWRSVAAVQVGRR